MGQIQLPLHPELLFPWNTCGDKGMLLFLPEPSRSCISLSFISFFKIFLPFIFLVFILSLFLAFPVPQLDLFPWFQSHRAEQGLGMCLGCSGHSCTSWDNLWNTALEKWGCFYCRGTSKTSGSFKISRLDVCRVHVHSLFSQLVLFDLGFPALLSQGCGSVCWVLGVAPGIAENGDKNIPWILLGKFQFPWILLGSFPVSFQGWICLLGLFNFVLSCQTWASSSFSSFSSCWDFQENFFPGESFPFCSFSYLIQPPRPYISLTFYFLFYFSIIYFSIIFLLHNNIYLFRVYVFIYFVFMYLLIWCLVYELLDLHDLGCLFLSNIFLRWKLPGETCKHQIFISQSVIILVFNI